jgi:hypothetical protein
MHRHASGGPLFSHPLRAASTRPSHTPVPRAFASASSAGTTNEAAENMRGNGAAQSGLEKGHKPPMMPAGKIIVFAVVVGLLCFAAVMTVFGKRAGGGGGGGGGGAGALVSGGGGGSRAAWPTRGADTAADEHLLSTAAASSRNALWSADADDGAKRAAPNQP